MVGGQRSSNTETPIFDWPIFAWFNLCNMEILIAIEFAIYSRRHSDRIARTSCPILPYQIDWSDLLFSYYNDHVITRHVSRIVDSRFKYIIRDQTDDRLNRVFYHKRWYVSIKFKHVSFYVMNRTHSLDCMKRSIPSYVEIATGTGIRRKSVLFRSRFWKSS